MPVSNGYIKRVRQRFGEWQNRQRIRRIAKEVADHAQPRPEKGTVLVFNVSARLTGLSQNAAFTLFSAWGLRLAGARVVHFVCQAGMRPCVLGTNRDHYGDAPPCQGCMAQSQRLYAGAEVEWFSWQPDDDIAKVLDGLNVSALAEFTYYSSRFNQPVPLGRLVMPAIRWALRRHTLPDDEQTRYLLRQYLLSAWNVARSYSQALAQVQPSVALIFNGIMYPEATARWVAQQHGVRVVTHEVGFQRFSSFFTDGEATAYPMRIPGDFELNPQQDARLDAYLEQRFQGRFSMAGIQFWPEMKRLDDEFLARAAQFRQIVPVFTNVIYDTSQVHANTIFTDMFAWLDAVQKIIRAHPETLFVIRAHPDEIRPGTKKQSRETVRAWVEQNKVSDLPNVVFIDSLEYISSYELIQRARFLMVYNSSIGLEAALMGALVLCGGKARYTQYPIVFLPQNAGDFYRAAEAMLTANEIEIPLDFQRNARRFLYYQLYKASLSYEQFLQTAPRAGFVQLSDFTWRQLLPTNCPTIRVLVDGVLANKPFLMDES